MRRLWGIGIRSGASRIALTGELTQGLGSPEDDYSQAAVMREIAWSLAGWLSFVVVVQLLLHLFRVT